MRPDLFHLIVERPRFTKPQRAGSHYPRGHLRGLFERDLEGAPAKLGIGFPHAEKHLNENLAPLRRWLIRQVGRPWAKVRSEIRAVVDPRSAVKLHVLQHLADFVVEHVEIVDGAPHGRVWGRSAPIVARWRGTPLWVCPRTGLLRAPPVFKPPPPRFGAALRLSTRAELREVEGALRFVELRPIPATNAARLRCFDVLLARTLHPDLFEDHTRRFDRTFGRGDAYAIAMRDPGKRELAHFASYPR